MSEQTSFEGIPRSERRKVSVVGTKAIETDTDLKMYDRVKMTISGYVSKVSYVADGDGATDRIHTIQADEIRIVV